MPKKFNLGKLTKLAAVGPIGGTIGEFGKTKKNVRSGATRDAKDRNPFMKYKR